MSEPVQGVDRIRGMLWAMASVLTDDPFQTITPELIAEAQRRAQEWLRVHPDALSGESAVTPSPAPSSPGEGPPGAT